MRCRAIVLASLVAVAGCRMDASEGDRIANLKAASARAAAKADSMMAWNPARVDTVLVGSSYEAARVAKALAAADITLPQIAAYLAERGWTVRQAAPPTWTWTPAPAGTYPVAYYTWRMVGAVGGNSLIHDIPQAVGPYRLEARAVDTHQNVGPWSVVGWSDGGDGGNSLPGVQE